MQREFTYDQTSHLSLLHRKFDCVYSGPSCANATVNPTLYDVDDDCASHGTSAANIISANSKFL